MSAVSCMLDRADDIVEEAYHTVGCKGRAWHFPSQSQMVCRELSPTFCGRLPLLSIVAVSRGFHLWGARWLRPSFDELKNSSATSLAEVPVRSWCRTCWRYLFHRRLAPKIWPFFRGKGDFDYFDTSEVIHHGTILNDSSSAHSSAGESNANMQKPA